MKRIRLRLICKLEFSENQIMTKGVGGSTAAIDLAKLTSERDQAVAIGLAAMILVLLATLLLARILMRKVPR